MRIDTEKSDISSFEFGGATRSGTVITLKFSGIVFRGHSFGAVITIDPEKVAFNLIPRDAGVKEVLAKHCRVFAEFGEQDGPQSEKLIDIIKRALDRIAKDADGIYHQVMDRCGDCDDWGPKGNLQILSYLAKAEITEVVRDAFKRGLLDCGGTGNGINRAEIVSVEGVGRGRTKTSVS